MKRPFHALIVMIPFLKSSKANDVRTWRVEIICNQCWSGKAFQCLLSDDAVAWNSTKIPHLRISSSIEHPCYDSAKARKKWFSSRFLLIFIYKKVMRQCSVKMKSCSKLRKVRFSFAEWEGSLLPLKFPFSTKLLILVLEKCSTSLLENHQKAEKHKQEEYVPIVAQHNWEF